MKFYIAEFQLKYVNTYSILIKMGQGKQTLYTRIYTRWIFIRTKHVSNSWTLLTFGFQGFSLLLPGLGTAPPPAPRESAGTKHKHSLNQLTLPLRKETACTSQTPTTCTTSRDQRAQSASIVLDNMKGTCYVQYTLSVGLTNFNVALCYNTLL
jgi:hypothetical protein